MSLVANERMVREAISTIELVFPGLIVEEYELRFRSASTNSPLKSILEGLTSLSFQGDMAKHIPDMVQKITGVKVTPEMGVMITIIVVALTSYGMYWAAEHLAGKKKGEAALTINGNYNQIIQVGRDFMGVESDVLDAVIKSRYAGRGKALPLSKKALELIRPAKQELGAGLEGGGAVITPEAVAASPSLAELETVDEETHDPYTEQAVDIHATDIDSNKSGWAGVLPGIYDKRLRMRLYPTIQPDELFGKRSVVADIILVSKINLHGDYVPYLFHVVRIYE